MHRKDYNIMTSNNITTLEVAFVRSTKWFGNLFWKNAWKINILKRLYYI